MKPKVATIEVQPDAILMLQEKVIIELDRDMLEEI